MTRISQPTHIAPLLVLVLRRYGIELTEEELRALGERSPPRPASPFVPVLPALPIQQTLAR